MSSHNTDLLWGDILCQAQVFLLSDIKDNEDNTMTTERERRSQQHSSQGTSRLKQQEAIMFLQLGNNDKEGAADRVAECLWHH